MSKKQTSKFAPFWRGFTSVLELSPTQSRSRDRDAIDEDALASVVIDRAWTQVGVALTETMKAYDKEQGKATWRKRAEAC